MSNQAPRKPCDQCTRRKVRCDYAVPTCSRCRDSGLNCTQSIVRKKRGPKKGRGTVLDNLRSQTPEASVSPRSAGIVQSLPSAINTSDPTGGLSMNTSAPLITQDQQQPSRYLILSREDMTTSLGQITCYGLSTYFSLCTVTSNDTC